MAEVSLLIVIMDLVCEVTHFLDILQGVILFFVKVVVDISKVRDSDCNVSHHFVDGMDFKDSWVGHFKIV